MKRKSDMFLSNIKWFGAASGAIVPGYTFFTTYPPPIFPMVSVLTSGLSAAIVYIGWVSTSRHFDKLIRRAIACLFLSFLMLAIYMLLLQYCTIIDPQGQERFQIGFWKCDWSLTQLGINNKQIYLNDTPQNWMMSEGAFIPGGPEKIWRAWSIAVAGILMLFTYMAGFVLWTAGFTLLAKHKSYLKEK